MQGKLEVCTAFFHGFNRIAWTTGGATQKLAILPAAQEHILKQNDGKNRFVKAVIELSKAFALAVPADEALAVVDDVAFYQAIRSVLTKSVGVDKLDPSQIDHVIRQIVSRAVSSDEVIDIFARTSASGRFGVTTRASRISVQRTACTASSSSR